MRLWLRKVFRRHYCVNNRAEELKRLVNNLNPKVVVDPVTLSSLLWACLNSQALPEGRLVHALIKEQGGDKEQDLGQQLVQMYLKCGSLADARELIDRIGIGDVVTWTRIVAAFAQKGDCWSSLRTYHEMLARGVRPNKITIVTLLNACVDQRCLPNNMLQIESNIEEMGFITDAFIGTVLMSLNGRLGRVEAAFQAFSRIQQHDVVSWNAMIWVYAQNDRRAEAVQLFCRMQLHGTSPTKVSFLAIFNACGGEADAAKRIHELLEVSGVEKDSALGNALVDMYAKSGCLEEAFNVFSCIPDLDVISWTAMIAAYVQCCDHLAALNALRWMQLQGVLPNKVTLLTILDIPDSSQAAEEIHAYVAESGLDSDIVMATAVVDMFGRSGEVDRAREVFERVEGKDVVLWTVFMGANVGNGFFKAAVKLFHQMQLEGIPPNKASFILVLEALGSLQDLEEGRRIHSRIGGDGGYVILGNAVINMFIKCGDLLSAKECFRGMATHDESSWNVIMSGGGDEEVLPMFREMQQQGFWPDRITLLAVINATARTCSSLSEARRIHQRVVSSGWAWETCIGNALVDMYSKCGSVQEATKVFLMFEQQDVISWNALIAGNAQHGNVQGAMSLMRRMQLQGLNPSGVTLVGLLSSFSAAGLIEQGCRLFGSMMSDYGIVSAAQHDGCMIDLLSRVGWIEEAQEFMSTSCCSDDDQSTRWLTLLGACNLHGDVPTGEYAANQLLHLDPGNTAGHVILSNLLIA